MRAARARYACRPNSWTTGCTTTTRCAAGPPAPARPWPTGCAAGASSPSSPSYRAPEEDEGDNMQIDKEIDTRGLNCPLPILKAKKALTEMESGQLLKVVSTDGGSLRDFQAFSKQTGNELVE